jgi:hypothetical protein
MIETFFIVVLCLACGGLAALATRRPDVVAGLAPRIGAALKTQLAASQPKRFSPRRTLFVIGPAANHPACRLQRRLIKPALAALIRDDIAVIEVYGDEPPRKNGSAMDWLDPALLRHALDAESGFFLIFIDDAGKTAFRSTAPVVTADLLTAVGLRAPETPQRGFARRDSAVLRRLRAA